MDDLKLKQNEVRFLKNVIQLCNMLDGFCDRNISCSECVFYKLGMESEDNTIPCLIYMISVLGTESRKVLELQGEKYD